MVKAVIHIWSSFSGERQTLWHVYVLNLHSGRHELSLQSSMSPRGNKTWLCSFLKHNQNFRARTKRNAEDEKLLQTMKHYVKYLEALYHNCMRTPDCRSLDTYYFWKWQMCPVSNMWPDKVYLWSMCSCQQCFQNTLIFPFQKLTPHACAGALDWRQCFDTHLWKRAVSYRRGPFCWGCLSLFT